MNKEKTTTGNSKKKLRKIYVDLLSNEKIKQPEKYCSNKIRTTKYSM